MEHLVVVTLQSAVTLRYRYPTEFSLTASSAVALRSLGLTLCLARNTLPNLEKNAPEHNTSRRRPSQPDIKDSAVMVQKIVMRDNSKLAPGK